MTQNIGSRLSGSPQAEKAVKWGEQLMKEVGLDSVWLQPVMVPHWIRGEKEKAYYTVNGKKKQVAITALGMSIGTSKKGIKGQIVEVKSLEEAESLGEQLRGKIVFFNGPFDETFLNTFEAYGSCAKQRFSGAAVAGKYGAKGAIVRSLTNNIDDYPHTGTLSYKDVPENQIIPAAAISTLAAEQLSADLKSNPNLEFYFKQSCETLADAPSYNVIGEIKGTEFPDKYIVVGGHLDSWDLGEGAHDDGAGIVQSLEVAYLFKKLNLKPKHTLRIVFFMNEENGSRGGKAYAEQAKESGEFHTVALESDSGGHTPRGFSIDANDEKTTLINRLKYLLEPYGLYDLTKGHGGVDIGFLKDENTILVGYKPDSQRYFDYHHSAKDTFDKVNKRELQLGSASMASMIYLLDKYLH